MIYNEGKKQVIIDTDPGVDDLVSILWVLANKNIEVKAITVTNGNVGVDKCATNALRALELCGRQEIPVYKGSYRPMVKEVINAEWYHGKDGLGDLGLPEPSLQLTEGYASVEMVRIAKESTEPVTILCLGPLTNVALAILLDKDFVQHVDKVLFMGGAVRVEGNESPRASYNVKVDSEAAKLVYHSGITVVQLGLDVCDLVTQEFSHLDKIVETKTPVARFLEKILYNRQDRVVKPQIGENGEVIKTPFHIRKEGIGLNDLTATGYLINEQWFSTMPSYIDVETSGLCDGETIIDYKGLCGKEENAIFAFDVDGKSLVSQWVEDMINFR